MSYETGDLPHRSGGDEESALESAARILRASARPARASPASERALLQRRQVRDLVAWAGREGRLIEAGRCLSRVEDQGEEHLVWLDVPSQRYFKLTHPGRFGFSVVALSETPELVAGMPSDYIERLLLQNRIFGDDVKLEGIGCEEDHPVILISQPNITGSEVTKEEIIIFMSELWFELVPGVPLGRPGALAFYRDLDEVAAFDAHPGNFVKDESGIVLPIDLILVRADEALQAALTGPGSAPPG